MKRFAVLLLFSSLLIFGCLNAPQLSDNSSIISAPKPVQVDTSTMKHYSNAGYGISFYYPSDWDLAPEYLNNYAVSDAVVNKTFVFITKNSNDSVNMIIVAMQEDGKERTLTEICVTNIRTCDNEFETSNLNDKDVQYYKKNDSGVEIIDGKRAYFRTFDIVYNPMNLSYNGEATNISTDPFLKRKKTILVSNNNITFVVAFSSPESIYVQNEADFDRILSTFEFSG